MSKMLGASCKILFQLLVVFVAYGQSNRQAIFHRLNGQYLKNSLILTKYVKSEFECSMHCTRLDECLSVNYKANERLCELNNNTRIEKLGVKNGDYIYLGIAIWSRKTLQSHAKAQVHRIENKQTCKEILTEYATLKDGVYNFKEINSTKIYSVYCQMTGIPTCGGGGWTLVMKTDGSKSTFAHSSPYWTNKELYKVENGLEGLTEKESKMASYWNTSFKKICLGMTVNDDTRWVTLDYEASSLYSLIADGQFRKTSAGRSAWKSLITGSSLQQNCNLEGFGISYPREIEMRLGYMANNSPGCGQSDSCIGFGIFYGSCGIRTNTSCGNIAYCSGTDNGPTLIPAFGYILVQ